MSYPKSVLKKAMEQLKEKQKEVKFKNSLEKDEIYRKIPELKILNGRIKNAMMSIFDGVSTDEIKKELLEIDLKKRELLKNAGYSEDALSDKHFCPICKDEAFYEGSKCACYLSFIKKEAYKLSNLGTRIENENFNTYDLNCFRDQKMAAIQRDYAKKYCNTDEKTPLNLFFSGGTGTGKTFLSSCIAKEFLDNGFSVLYLSATDLSDIADKAKFRNDENGFNEEYLDFVESCDLLIVDDLGTEYSFPYPQSKIFDILEKRIIKQKRTVISTNLSLNDMAAKYSPRFYSRIMKEYKIIQFKGDDLRTRALNS